MLRIFLGNLTEGSGTYIRGLKDEQTKKNLIEEDNFLADRFLFSAKDDMILITPNPINNFFIQDLTKILKLNNFQNWSLKNSGVSICKALEEDKDLFKKLLDLMREQNGEVELTAYCNTPEFFGLVRELKSRNIQFSTPEAPALDFDWVVGFLGSKGGFRQVAQMISGWEKEVKMPWGLICAKATEARDIGRVLFEQGKGFVAKTNWGQSGEGLIIIRTNNGFKTYDEVNKYLKEEFEKEDFWHKYPIIVEEFITADLTVAGGNPDVEMFIDSEGKIHTLYSCGMRVTREGNFRGVEIGKEVLSLALDKKIRRIGLEIAEEFAQFGLKGFFDVDMQYSQTGEIFCLESNVRRTGGTHVYDAGVRLFGQDFAEKKYLVSNNWYQNELLATMDYQKLKEILREIWYPMAGKQIGFLPTVVSALDQKHLGYLIISDKKEEAVKIENRMEELLAS